MPSVDMKTYLAGVTPVNTNEYSDSVISSTQNAADLRLSITKSESAFDLTSMRLPIDPVFYNNLIHPDGSLIITDFRVIFHFTGSGSTYIGGNSAIFQANALFPEPDVYIQVSGLPEFTYPPASTTEIQSAGTYASSDQTDDVYLGFGANAYGTDPVTAELEIVAFTIETPEPPPAEPFWTNRNLTLERNI